jgi:hypothetical protein
VKYFLLLALSLNAHALTGHLKTSSVQADLDYYYDVRIEEIYLMDQTAKFIFKKGWQLYEGQELKLKFSQNRVCNVRVKSLWVKRGLIIIDTCPYKKDIKKGQLLHIEPLKYTVDKTYRPNTILDKEKEKIGDLPSKNESWYIYTAFGVSPIAYDPVIDEAIKAFTGDDSSPVAFFMNPIGFYFPVAKHRSMIGVTGSVVFDRFFNESSFEETDTTTVNQTADLVFWQFSISASYFYFFGQNIGDGWFARADLGISSFWGNLEVTYRANDSDRQGLNQTYSYNPGIDGLIGGGYSWPISLWTRMLLNANYQYKSALDKDTGELYSNNIFVATLGFLF